MRLVVREPRRRGLSNSMSSTSISMPELAMRARNLVPRPMGSAVSNSTVAMAGSKDGSRRDSATVSKTVSGGAAIRMLPTMWATSGCYDYRRLSSVGTGADTYLFGYPATPYSGKDLIYSQGPLGLDPLNKNLTYRVASDMTGGSSGGPWFTPFTGGTGTMMSVNSYGYTGITAMHGPKFNTNTLEWLRVRVRSWESLPTGRLCWTWPWSRR